MYHSLYFHFIATKSNSRVLKIFFEDWTDSICNNEVKYSIVNGDKTSLYDIIRVDFANEEDATVVKLIGIPKEFQNHLKLINSGYAS